MGPTVFHIFRQLGLILCLVVTISYSIESQDLGLQNVENQENLDKELTTQYNEDSDSNLETTTALSMDMENTKPLMEPATTEKTVPAETTEEMIEGTTEENAEEFGVFQFFSGFGEGKDEAGGSDNDETEISPEEGKKSNPGEVRLSQQIRTVLSNYRQYRIVTLPVSPLPDPMPLPDVKKNLAGSPMNFTNIAVHGLSDFEIDHVNTDLDKMQVYLAMKVRRVVLLGNYSIRSWLSKGSGGFNITLLDVLVDGSAQLEKNSEGKLTASDSEMDMTFVESVVDFKNTGVFGSIIQGVLGSAGSALFDAVKPTILKEVNDKMRADVNDRLEKMSVYIGDYHPLDKAVEEGRKYVKSNGYDPYHVKDYTVRDGLFRLNVTELWLLGLSKFSRVGGVSFSMDSGAVQAGIHLTTGKLYGRCHWSLGFGNFNRTGSANFTLDTLQVKSAVNQSLDVSEKPVLDKLDIILGKPVIVIDQKDQVDKFIQYVLNALPSFIRHIVVDSLEEPISQKIQSILNEINVEELVEKTLPALDEIGL